MPARASRRDGRYSQVDHQVLQAIFQHQVLGNSGEYGELLSRWETKREAAIRDQEAAEQLRKEATAEIAAGHEKLETRKTRFVEYASAVADGLIAVCNDTDDYDGVTARIRAAEEAFENA